MSSNAYEFTTRWRVKGTCAEISDELGGEASELLRWWPSLYLDAKVLEQGDQQGIGRVVALYTKGWLPYTLRWNLKITNIRYPHGFTLQAIGDFDGTGDWNFKQDGEWVDITYDWKIFADKPLLR